MAIPDDLDEIKADIKEYLTGFKLLGKAMEGIVKAMTELSAKIDWIKSNGNEDTVPKTVILKELQHLFSLLARGDKTGASVIAQRLTGCSARLSQQMMEDIDVADPD